MHIGILWLYLQLLTKLKNQVTRSTFVTSWNFVRLSFSSKQNSKKIWSSLIRKLENIIFQYIFCVSYLQKFKSHCHYNSINDIKTNRYIRSKHIFEYSSWVLKSIVKQINTLVVFLACFRTYIFVTSHCILLCWIRQL